MNLQVEDMLYLVIAIWCIVKRNGFSYVLELKTEGNTIRREVDKSDIL